MIRAVVICYLFLLPFLANSQQEIKKAIVLINGDAHLVDISPKGDIVNTYQRIDNYFSLKESPSQLIARFANVPAMKNSAITFFESEKEPEPTFKIENKAPVITGNSQFIGFSPGRAVLQKQAVNQIRKISKAYRDGQIQSITATSYYSDNYRSRSLSRNRAKAIKDLLIAFGLPSNIINTQTVVGANNVKIDYVNIGF